MTVLWYLVGPYSAPKQASVSCFINVNMKNENRTQFVGACFFLGGF